MSVIVIRSNASEYAAQAAASAATAAAVSGSGNGTFANAALTGVTSVTAGSATNLTLNGGSSGASLEIRQGANGGAAFTPAGTGTVWIQNAQSLAANRGGELKLTGFKFAAGTYGNAFASVKGGKENGTENDNKGYLAFKTNNDVAGEGYDIAERARISPPGNLLIGGTTDITGSGGLKVFGTTAASSTTSGALQVAGGVGIAGKLYIGSTLDMAGAISGANSVTSAASTSLVLTGNGGTSLTLPSNAAGGAVASLNHGFYASYSYDGDTAGIRMTNASTGGSAAAVLQAVNNNSVIGALAVFSSTHGVTTLRDKTTINATGSIRVFTNSASSSGQAGTFVVAPGGYNDADVLTVSRTATTSAKPLSVTDSTASTSTSTGALVVSGGIGAAGRVTAGSFSAPGGTSSEMFGAGSTLGTNTNNTALGASATTASGNTSGNVAVGKSASAIGGDDVAIGASSSAAPGRSVALGVSANTATNNYGVAIGWSAASTGGVRIGGGGSAGNASISIGVYGMTTTGGQIWLGCGNSDADAWFGAGSAAATGYYTRINGTGHGSAGGTGGILYLAGGKGGDAASTGGAVTIQTANAGAGTTLVNSWSVAAGGRIAHTPSNFSLPSWTTSGALTNISASTVTNSSTAASGTAASAVFHSFAAPTLAATNASVTTTSAATVYIAGGPTAGTNQTITTSYGLWVAGKAKVDDYLSVASDQNSIYAGGWPRTNFTTNGSSVWSSGSTTGAATLQHDFQNRSGTSLLALYGTGNATLAGALTVSSSTASTSTTTGALVVSGGVGVAGAAYFGGKVTVPGGSNNTLGILLGTSRTLFTNSSGHFTFQADDGASTNKITLENGNASINALVFSTGSTDRATIQQASSSSNLVFQTTGTGGVAARGFQFSPNNGAAANTTALDVQYAGVTVGSLTTLTVNNTTEATTGGAGSLITAGGIYATKKVITASTLTTAAPTSGTAKEWKLGEAASVSPTSPNRTIRVEVDGVVYYIAAKTTND